MQKYFDWVRPVLNPDNCWMNCAKRAMDIERNEARASTLAIALNTSITERS
jgi:hypothetical protein